MELRSSARDPTAAKSSANLAWHGAKLIRPLNLKLRAFQASSMHGHSLTDQTCQACGIGPVHAAPNGSIATSEQEELLAAMSVISGMRKA